MRRKAISCVIYALMIITSLLLVVPGNTNAHVVVTEEWVARYESGWGQAIAVDSSGNIYVTGYIHDIRTHSDYLTLAYDSLGNQLWEARYNGPGNWTDWAHAIAIDEISGNIIVTGRSWGNGTSEDYTTIAYSTKGTELWVARYNGPVDWYDTACDITVDTSGNVYVTGTSQSGAPHQGGTCEDYTTVAYDSKGHELWVARYNGPGNRDDRAQAIAVDLNDNIFVTGLSSRHKWVDHDYATIKYDSNGTELWVKRYGFRNNKDDAAYDVAVDSLGNIYVTGSSYNKSTGHDYATIAYDTHGNELWVARGPIGSASHVALDTKGNVYVTGHSSGITTVAYNSSGNQKWIVNYDSSGKDLVSDMAVDLSGNIYVTGRSYSIGGGDSDYYVTIAYDSNGNEQWVARYKGPGVGMINWAEALALDSCGNVYVTGGSEGNMTTIKYSQQIFLGATINIDPDTLNLKSKGRWITCYITLNNPYDVNDIDISTILLEDTIPAEWGDIQGYTLMVKFDRSEVENMLSPGTYNLKVTGELTDGTEFEGYSDEIRIIDPP
jgi:hypothetical protein